MDFAWSPTGTGDFVVRESISRIKLFKNFKEIKSEKPRVCTAEGLYGGSVIGIRGSDCIAFYDWDELRLIRKIDVLPCNVFWSDSGELLLVACEESYYVLQFNREAVANAFADNKNTVDEGIEGAFELLHEISEKVCTGQWIGDCFVYANESGRLNYYVGGEVMTINHFDQKLYLLGYLPKENRLFLTDKLRNVYSYTVNLAMLEYQTAVVREDFDLANDILPRIPGDQIDNVARFLESQGFKEEALQLSTDPDHKFDLAVQLSKLEIAKEIMVNEIGDCDTTDAQHKWKQLGDLALNECNLNLAEDCALRSDDYSGLLMMYSSKADYAGMESLAIAAKQNGRNNVTFVVLFLMGRLEHCVELLLETKRFPEAAFFARTYIPSFISKVVDVWKNDLRNVSAKAAKSLADPSIGDSNQFPLLNETIEVEKMMKEFTKQKAMSKNFAEGIISSLYEVDTVQNYIQSKKLGFREVSESFTKESKSIELLVEKTDEQRTIDLMIAKQDENEDQGNQTIVGNEAGESKKIEDEREEEGTAKIKTHYESEELTRVQVQYEAQDAAPIHAEHETQEVARVQAVRDSQEATKIHSEQAERKTQEAARIHAQREAQEPIRIQSERGAQDLDQAAECESKIEKEVSKEKEHKEHSDAVNEITAESEVDFDLDNDDFNLEDDCDDWGDM